MSKLRLISLVTLVLLSASCTAPTAPTAAPASSASPSEPSSTALSREEAIAKAGAAFGEFGEELKSELTQAMREGGPVNAVKVCQQRAPQLAAEHSKRLGFPLGRSSHRLRSDSNAPDQAIASYLEQYSKSGPQAPVEAYQHENQWTVVAPIVTQPMCLTCHGDPQTFSAELKAALAQSYPHDKATGFQAGDLRGVFWARLP